MRELDFLVVGHIAIDVNVFPWGVIENVLGGAPTYGGFLLAGLGAKVGILSKVGFDFSRMFPPIFSKFGLDTEGLIVTGERSTTFRNVYDEQGNRTQSCTYLAPQLTLRDIPSYYTNMLGVYVSPLGNEVSVELLQELRRRTKFVMMDPQGLFRKIREDGRIELRAFRDLSEYLQYLDIVKVGRDEIVVFGEKSPSEIAQSLREMGCSVAVVTLGEKGCVVAEGSGVESFPALKVEAKDLTGAGDVFGAAFLYKYAETQDAKLAARFANAAAGLKIRYRGIVGFPSLSEIEEVLE